MIWGTVVIFGTANSVNLTDGLDGLAAGSAAFVFGFLALVGFVQYRHPGIYGVHSALDLALARCRWAERAWGSCGGRGPGAGDHGRHRLAVDRDRPRLPRPLAERAAVASGDRGLVRPGDVVGGDPGRQFRMFHRRAFDGSPASPLRTERLARDHRHSSLFDLSGLCVALGLGLFYADFLSTARLK